MGKQFHCCKVGILFTWKQVDKLNREAKRRGVTRKTLIRFWVLQALHAIDENQPTEEKPIEQ